MSDISLSAEPLTLVIEGFKGRGHALCDGPMVIGWLNPTFGEVPMRRVVDALRAYYANNQTALDLDRVTAQRDELAAALAPFALIASEGVITADKGHVTVTTCAEYFLRAAAALAKVPS